MGNPEAMKNFSIFEKISQHVIKGTVSTCYIESFYKDYINECISLQKNAIETIRNSRVWQTCLDRSSMYILKRIIRNKFLTSKQHEYLVRYWGKIQRHYYVLSRFVTKIKYRHCKSITDNDLCLESLDDLSASIVISVIDNNALYRFRMSDIINIVNAKLSHAPDFFAEPLPITNPYTNDYFTDSQLYNIYFKIKHSTYIMPHLFHMFFLSGFNINDFLNDNEATLRDFTIEKYTKTLTEEQKFKHIKKFSRTT